MLTWLIRALWIGCQVLDLSSTAAAMADGRFEEGNRVMSKRPAIIFSIKLGGNAGLLVMKPTRESKIIGVTMAAAGCFAGAWNTYQLRRD